MFFATLVALAHAMIDPLNPDITDQRVDPPSQRLVHSPDKEATLKIATLDHWQTPFPTATLTINNDLRYTVTLPHWHGPKHALVTDDGIAVLLDEWPNIKNQYAVTVLSPQGQILKSWSTQQIQDLLGLTAEQLATRATQGVWLSGRPAQTQTTVQIPAAQTTLNLDLKTLTLTPL